MHPKSNYCYDCGHVSTATHKPRDVLHRVLKSKGLAIYIYIYVYIYIYIYMYMYMYMYIYIPDVDHTCVSYPKPVSS